MIIDIHKQFLAILRSSGVSFCPPLTRYIITPAIGANRIEAIYASHLFMSSINFTSIYFFAVKILMVTVHNVTTKKDFVLPLQYVSEGDSITTPANFGVTPSSPTYIAAGRVLELQINRDITDTPVNVLGDEDVFDSIKNEELYTFTVKSQIYDTNLLAYGIEPCGGGAGSIDESLSFKFSKNLAGTEYFTKMTGCRCTSTTLSLSMGAWEMDQTWVCQDISIDNTTDPDTTPTNITSIPTTTVWRHQDTGSTPFTWNSTNFGERSFGMTVTRDLATYKVNGQSTILYTKPSHRGIDVSIDVIRNTTTLLTDFENKTERTFSYELNNGTAQLDFTGGVITSWDERHTATDTDILIEPVTIRAEAVTIS